MGFPLWTVRSSSTTHEDSVWTVLTTRSTRLQSCVLHCREFCERHPSIELKRADASLFIDSYEYGDIH